jgi:GR25 family glycosyltransferase involved in LPS biosynthesis
MNFDITIVASHHRTPIVTNYISGIHHFMNFTPDYQLESNFNPKHGGYVRNHIGAMRCFRGHQDALKNVLTHSNKDFFLVMEDDAVTNTHDWINILENSIKNIEDHDLITLHARQYTLSGYSKYADVGYGRSLYKVAVPRTWAVASLAYVIKREACNKIIDAVYDGLPLDLFLYFECKYALLDPSCFNHGNVKSLID